MSIDVDRLAAEMVRGAQLLIDKAVAAIKLENADLRQKLDDMAVRLSAAETRAMTPGPDGQPGIDGRDGIDGKDGATGERGPEGPQGKDGLAGADGLPGGPGADGLDGIDGIDGKDGSAGERGADGAPGKDGLAGDRGGDGIDGTNGLDGVNGIDGRDGIDGTNGKDGERGIDGRDGKLPIVKAWADQVHYAGDCVTLAGATWQAARDTGQAPPHGDWTCIAAAGRSLNPTGTYDETAAYRFNDTVAMNGGSFVALTDDPGECPGAGWQLLTAPGKRGQKGEDGARGLKGDTGPQGRAAEPVALKVTDDGVLTLLTDTGRELTADFYPILRGLK